LRSSHFDAGGESRAVNLVRSTLFALGLLLLTPPWAVLSLFTYPLPRLTRSRLITGWSRIVMHMAGWILGIRWQVQGRENLPARPSVILSNHQSAWETIAFQVIFPTQVWLMKRELLWIPFFGWGLAMMSPIPIDRQRGVTALRALARRGKERLTQGFWVVVFPEGTRMHPGKPGRFRVGGAWLATEAGAPVVPVAHNAGLVWPRNAFVKRPGIVTVRIGPAIETAGRSAEDVNALAKAWIDAQHVELGTSG
jgi:1-acyl-sn-glycerol-3-phosphate acyltransferase